MVELLKQGQYTPLPVNEQVCMIFAGTKGYLDNITISDVPQFERELLEFIRDQKPEILDAISETGAIRDEDELIGAINEFKSLDESYRDDEAAENATDDAAEAADLAKNRILAQSATAMLAQASAISQNILGLLR